MKHLFLAMLLMLGACGNQETPETETSTVSEDASEFPIRMASEDEVLDEQAEAVMASINPLENDLRGLEVAMRVEDAFIIKPQGALFQLAVTLPDGSMPIDEEFVLEETFGVTSDQIIAAEREGFYIRTYRLSEADKPRMGAAYEQLQIMKENSDGNNELLFQTITKSCIRDAENAPGSYRLTNYVRSHPDVDFIILGDEMIMERTEMTEAFGMWDICESDDL